jgi:hypothetical protein
MSPNLSGRLRLVILKRVLALMEEDSINCRSFCDDTGFSEDQYYYWTGAGKKTGIPSVKQSRRIHETYDWSPSYTYFGVGPKRLSELSGISAVAEDQAIILNKLDKLLLK